MANADWNTWDDRRMTDRPSDGDDAEGNASMEQHNAHVVAFYRVQDALRYMHYSIN
jgi:hypothetical protein